MASGVRVAVEGYKPLAAAVAAQCIGAVSTVWVKAAFRRGTMNPMVLVVYRQGIATLVLVPVTVVAKRTRLAEAMNVGVKGLFLVFVGVLFGATVFMNLCYLGLHLGSSSLATAMTNLIPAITFLMAAAVGQERVDIREVGSIAKILGTAICFGGAIIIAFFKGLKLLNQTLNDSFMLPHSLSSEWVIAALLLMTASCCWALWAIMQGPILKSYMDPLTLTTLSCFFSTLQSATLAFFILPDKSAWKIHSLFELSCYIFAGAVGSGVSFFLRSWCISVKGPLYWAMFTPLATVITAVFADILLHEELHIGSFVGGVGIIFGLYVVLWGKAEDRRRGMVPVERKVENEDSQLDVENALAEPLLVDALGSTQQPQLASK